jgi:hypothetical protein
MNTALSYPENVPTQTGYYVVKYLNQDHNEYYFKALVWNGEQWCGWRRSGWAGWKNNLNDLVKEFYPDTHDEHYVPSMTKANI